MSPKYLEHQVRTLSKLPTEEDRIKVIRNSLAEFKALVEPVLDLEMVYFDRPCHTLRMAIEHFEEALGVNWRDHHQSGVSDELVSSFAQVAHNLSPRALKEAIEWLHFTTQDMLLLRERG
jgi:hypothetical protein